MCKLKVSVEQGLFTVGEGNWLVTYEKLNKIYASFHTEFGLLLGSILYLGGWCPVVVIIKRSHK